MFFLSWPRILLAVLIACLASCYAIVSVEQPSTGLVNQEFTATVYGEADSSCSACNPVFGIAIPPSWTLAACSYKINTGALQACLEDPTGQSFSEDGLDPNTQWRQFAGALVEIESGQTITVEWKVLPTTTGSYTLGYMLGAYAPPVGEGSGTLAVSEAAFAELSLVTASPVPFLGGIHWVFLSLSCVAIAFYFSSKARREWGQVSVILASLLFVTGLMSSVGESAATSDTTLLELNQQNVIRVLTELRKDTNSVRPLVAEAPKLFVTERFLLTEAQNQWLMTADEEALGDSIGLLLSVEDLSSVSCRFLGNRFLCSE